VRVTGGLLSGGHHSFRSAYAVFRGDYCLPPTASASRLRPALACLHDTAARGPSDHGTPSCAGGSDGTLGHVSTAVESDPGSPGCQSATGSSGPAPGWHQRPIGRPAHLRGVDLAEQPLERPPLHQAPRSSPAAGCAPPAIHHTVRQAQPSQLPPHPVLPQPHPDTPSNHETNGYANLSTIGRGLRRWRPGLRPSREGLSTPN
jgi:hypothetical protein